MVLLQEHVLERPWREREYFIDNLLVRIHFIIMMIWWTGLAPCSNTKTTTLECFRSTGSTRLQKSAPPQDPNVDPCLGSKGGPRGVEVLLQEHVLECPCSETRTTIRERVHFSPPPRQCKVTPVTV